MRRLVSCFVVAWGMFLSASAAPHLLARAGLHEWVDSAPWLRQLIVKSVLVGLTLAAMAISGRSTKEMGFAPARVWGRRLQLAGFGLGVLASALVFLTPARGMGTVFEGFSLLAMILSIWIYSSVAEELFTRGWFQSVLTRGDSSGRSSRTAVVASAILFGSMHLSLAFMGVDGWTVAIIVAATTLLGLVAAMARDRSGSLGPAITVHALFNVGGFVAGVTHVIATIARTGRPPVP